VPVVPTVPGGPVTDLVRGQDRVGQLSGATPGHEDLGRLVDPDLLDRGILQIPLQGPEPGHRIEHALGRLTQVRQRRQPAMQRALVIVGNRVTNELSHLDKITAGVKTRTADQLAHFTLDGAYGIHPPTPALFIRPSRSRQPRNLHPPMPRHPEDLPGG